MLALGLFKERKSLLLNLSKNKIIMSLDMRSFKKGWVLRLNGGKDATWRVVDVCFDPLGTTFYSLKYKNDPKK